MNPDTLQLIGCSTPDPSDDATPALPAPVFRDDQGQTWIFFDNNGHPSLANFPPMPGDEAWEALAPHASARFTPAETPAPNDPPSRPAALTACITQLASPQDAAQLAGAAGGPVCGYLAAAATRPENIAATLAELQLTTNPTVAAAAMAASAADDYTPPSTLGVATPVPAVHAVLAAGQRLLDQTHNPAEPGTQP